MRGENTQNSTLESKMFRIHVDQYKKDIDSLLSKEKKDKILELFTNSNQLYSEEEFNIIEYNLHNACREGDIDLIQIFLSETIENPIEGLTFKINRTNQTASLFKVSNIEHLVIPRTFQYESTEYLITSIKDTNYNIKSIKFAEDSAINTIFGGAFLSSKIEEIYFPKSLKELREGWCHGADKLTKIIISPSNDQFIFNEDKYLLGKTDPTSDEFDKFLFVRRDIKEISIPSNIKIISSYAFSNSNIERIFIPSKISAICEYAFCFCKNLKKVEIPPNSNLQTIGSHAFSNSNIEEIYIPSTVSTICEYAFSDCYCLKKVEIPPNSNLQTIGPFAFLSSKIEEIYFPTSLKELREGWCHGADKLTKIIISPSNDQFIFNEDKYLLGKTDPTSDEFDKFLFVRRDIKEISIPSNIKIISSYAFSNSNIERIFIPSKISAICEYAFCFCKNLKKVEIPPNSNLQTIGSYAFFYSNIEEIYIPSTVSTICERAFCTCKNLKKVEISPNSNLQTIGSYAFSETNIEEIYIPSKVSTICEYAFSDCQNLRIIEIAEESGLKSISFSDFYEYSKLIIMAPPPLLRK